ncbi:hypothetical protein SPHINGO8AM_80017 [Sphingomonas sp. 8AM]|nr:hypothetical protein SPHINGO8AM_80017 [Sphingomonas sp. 8AM]
MTFDRRRLLLMSFGMIATPACSQPQPATVRPEDFGATGRGDDTAAIQRMANVAAAGGQRIDAQGRSYQVDNVYWPGGTRLSHIRLVLCPGDRDDRSPVAIGQRGKTTRDLIFENVIVDGNRAAQEHVGRSGYADGARSGFQIRGRVEQVVIRNCKAVNCATDGVMIFSDLQHGADDRPILRDITLLNVIATDNRRHGLSADAFDNLAVVGCTLSRNGADLEQGIASDHGLAAARFNGTPYGRPFDIEDYLVGTGWSGLRIEDTDCRGNRTGALVYSQVSPDSPGFVARRGLWISRCRFDEPGGSRWDPPLGIAQLVEYRGQKPTFRDVALVNNIFENGPLRISGVDGLSLRGGRIAVTKPNETEPVIVANCRRISIVPGHA